MQKYKSAPIKVPRFEEKYGFYTTSERSELMKKIKSGNTKSEIILRKVLWGLGIRYRKNYKKLPGTPDIVIPKYKLIIFVDGEFWHGFEWEKKKKCIKSNRDFWIPKIERNIQRDAETNNALREMGWTVLRFWDQQIKKELGNCVNIILREIDKDFLM